MRDTVILVTNFGMGKADEKLQVTLVAKYFELLAQRMVPVMMVIHDHRVHVSLRCAGEVMREQYERDRALDLIVNGLRVMRWIEDGNMGGIFKYPPFYYPVRPEQIQSLL